MALPWTTRIPSESELEREYDIPRPLMGPIADPVGQGSVTPPVNDASAASSLLDLITAIENDIVIRGASDWGALGTGAMGRSLLGTATAASGRGLLDVLSVAEVAAGYQPLDADLTAIAALTTTTFGRSLLTEASASSLRTTLGAGSASGLATLDSGGKVPLSQISDAILGQVEYQGSYNATTNTPTLADPPASTTKGDYYVVSVAGTQFGLTFAVGDWIISNGTAWEKVDNTDQVTSVAGRIGAITLGYADITDLASWTGSSGITTVGALNSGSITSGFGSINVGADSITGGAGSFTTLAASDQVTGEAFQATGGITTLAANSVILDFVSTYGRILALGADAGTMGEFRIALAGSDGTGYSVIGKYTSAGHEITGTVTTSDPNNGQGAWLLGKNRTGIALTVSTTNGIQVKVDGSLYTLAVLTTNP